MKPYDTYKDSGIEWIGEIPSHWEVRRFNYLFAFSRGLSITKQDLKDEGVPCVNYGEIHSKFGFKVNPEIHSLKNVDTDYLTSSKKSLLNRGDFVFADTSEDIEGSGNFTCLDSDIPTFAGYHTIIARQLKNNNYSYLAYFFDSLEFRNQIRSEVSGIKVFSITQSILKNSNVLLPVVQEQTAIAAFLDRKTTEIDALIADKKRLLELYKEEKTAVINQAVTKGINPKVKMKDSGIEWLGEIPEHWDVKKLKYVFNSLNYIRIPLSSEERGRMINREYDYYGASGVIDKVEDFLFEEPLLLIGEDGANLISRSTRLAFIARGKYWVNNHAHILRPKYGILEYYSEILELCDYSIWISGSAQPKLTAENLLSVQICIPPHKEQQSIVRYIETECARIDAKIDKTKKLIELLTEYRTALISEVVTGKLKVV